MDVAAVFAALCRLPVIGDRLDRLAGRKLLAVDIQRLAALVYLHDLGKLMPGFQAKARPDLKCRADVNHSSAGALLLGRAVSIPGHALACVPQIIGGWGEAVEELILAIFAHHGRPISFTPGDDPETVAGYDMAAAIHDYLGVWARAFPNLQGGGALPGMPGFVHMIAGLAALADWIGSDRRFFEFVARPGLEYPEHARQCARLALRTIGLDRAKDCASTDFASIAGGAFSPRAAQKLVGEADPHASPLLILEAETGSGKTEAAIWRFALLHAAGLVSGLYFAVPTRAAARQLHRRVNAAMRRLFGAEAPEAVLAIPGQILAGESEGERLPDFEVRWDDTAGPQPTRWAAEHATRFLAAPIAIGTVDQAMLAGLQVKHAHLRGAALARSLLVVDEVHSSDEFMTEILAELLHGHLAAGGQAMLMSATLGSRARSRFLKQPAPDLQTAIAALYPALWSLGAPHPAASADEAGRKAVRMERLPTMDATETATRAISLARQGARVLVIRNTVTEAVATFDAVIAAAGGDLLMQAGNGPALHHSRFAVEDRAILDRAVETLLMPRKDRQTRGGIAIGSQTLEQSLDICADYLITDLCPVDVLLQRLGRLHRHNLPRPKGFETPQCLVLCPEGGLDPLTKPAFVNGLGAWKLSDGTIQGIYLDLACLSLTERLICEHPIWTIPAMNRTLVERATHREACEAEIARRGPAWEGYGTRIFGRDAAHRGQAQTWLLRRDKRFPETFPLADESVQTRLGAQGSLLSFAPGTIGPFGTEITRITLPAHWGGITALDTPIAAEATAEGLRFSLGEATFLYTRAGLVRA